MSVVAANELPRSGEETKDRIGHTRRWIVQTNDVDDAEVTVLSYASIPVLFQSYAAGNDIDLNSYVESRRAIQRSDNKFYWDVEVQYSSQAPSGDPFDRETKISYSFERGERTPTIGTTGTDAVPKDGIINSAGQLFDPPPMEEFFDLVVTLNKPLLVFDVDLHLDIIGTVNNAAWQGAKKAEARLTGVVSNPESENDVDFWDTTYTFKYVKGSADDPEDGHKAILLDYGWFEKSEDDDPPILALTDKRGQKYEHRLDGEGKKLAAGEPSVFKRYQPNRATNFSRLPIP